MMGILRTINIGKTLIRCLSNGNAVTKAKSGGILYPAFPNGALQFQLVQLPLYEKHRIVLEDIPTTNLRINDPKNIFFNEILEIPKYTNIIEEIPIHSPEKSKIEAARLIVIRKRKMKKHKLKKLRKKMKFEWAKVRQRREMRKEKAFQAELIEQIKVAEKFSAENYVSQKLKEANETPIPRYWKGRRLPQFIIKEKLNN